VTQDKKSPQDNEALALGFLVGMPAIGIIAFWLLKFVPMVCIGAGVGYFYFAAIYQKNSSTQRARVGILSFLAFTLFLLLLAGVPFIGRPKLLSGVLFQSKFMVEVFGNIVSIWNNWVPNWMPKSVKLKNVTILDVSRYIWLSWFFSLIFCGLYFLRHSFAKKQPEKSLFFLSITSAPARLLNRILFLNYLFGTLNMKLDSKLESGFRVGMNFNGETFDLTEKNLNYHVELVAPTGSGKTNLLKNLIANRISEGHGVIFLDFKADFEMVSWIYRAAKAANRERELRLFSLSDPTLSVPYNPFKYGDPTDVHSALMNAMTWSEPFYRSVSSVALLLIIRGLDENLQKTGEHYHLGHIYNLLDDPRQLSSFANRLQALGCPSAPKVGELAAKLEKPKEKDNLMGLLANLNQLLFSSAGDLLSTDVVSGSFDFRDAIPKGEIVVMLMNSLKLKESAQVVGKLILQDLMSYVGNYYGKSGAKATKPVSLIIDEFAGFATPQFIEFMDRARGAGIGIVLSHQSRADLRQVSPEFQERVEANSNTVLVSGVKNPQRDRIVSSF
jgi:hypothetical protein